MSIAQRMNALVIVVMVGLLAMTGLAYYQINRVYDGANYANKNSLPSIRVLDDANDHFQHLNGLIWQHMAQNDNAKMSVIETEIATTHQELTDALKSYEKLVSNQKDIDFLQADLAALAAFDEMGGNVLTDSLAGKKNAARESVLAGKDVVQGMQNALTNHREYNAKLGADSAVVAAENKSQAISLSLFISLAIILVSVV